MQSRLDTRHEAILRGYHNFPHNTAKHWQDVVADSADLNFDAVDGEFVIDLTQLPRHLESPLRRLAKRLAHGLQIWP
jgi:hypothetical protein